MVEVSRVGGRVAAESPCPKSVLIEPGGFSLHQSGLSGGHGQNAGSACAFAGNQINRRHLRVRLRVVNRRHGKAQWIVFSGRERPALPAHPGARAGWPPGRPAAFDIPVEDVRAIQHLIRRGRIIGVMEHHVVNWRIVR